MEKEIRKDKILKMEKQTDYFSSLSTEQKNLFIRGVLHYQTQIQTIDSASAAEGYDGPASVSASLNSSMDKVIAESFEKSKDLGQKVSCKKGCSFCCHINVDITSAEASLLSTFVRDHHLPHLIKQENKSLLDWNTLPYADRKCVFLGDTGECTVYENRPLSCRKYFVVSPAEDCNTEGRTEAKGVMAVGIGEAEIATTALSMVYGSGSMAKMLIQELVKEKIKQDGRKQSAEVHQK